MSLKEVWLKFNENLENYLIENLIKEIKEPEILNKAMLYSLEGGKRVRPFLAYLGYKLNKDEIDNKLYDLACALELIHNFSLVHDDLPALDNDDYRRNKLTVHKKFSEAIAILTGDALFAYAFKFLNKIDKEISSIVIEGTLYMIKGQVKDIQKNINSLNELLELHYYKTGKLIEASLVCGYLLSDGENVEIVKIVGKNIGAIFQLVDDLLDKDKKEDINILKFLSYKEVKEMIGNLKEETKNLIKQNFRNYELLNDFIELLSNRDE
ncbi:MAG: polyprenyl synthetase family protein [candidate division WOR-3 bacterium]|jgi:geranylgeranyl diphosphate synthase type II